MKKIKLWFKAVRPFSFPMTFISVGLGTVMAIRDGFFSFHIFLLSLLGCLLIHSGTNLINDYYDYKSGIDTIDSHGSSGILVAKALKPVQIKIFGILCFLLVIPIALYLTYLRGVIIAILAVVAVIGGYFYTAAPVSYKYYALGVPLVFLLMGPLMVIGSYYVQTGSYNNEILLVSIPVGLLIIAVLQGNELRDIKYDSKKGIKTLSILLGRKRAKRLYLLLITLPYLFLIYLVMSGIITSWSLVVLMTLPYACGNINLVRKSIVSDNDNLKNIDLKTAKLHLRFGTLLVMAVVGSTLL